MLAFVVTVAERDVEVASDVLWQLGVRAIEERVATSASGEDAIELWTSVGEHVESIERAQRVIGARWPTRTELVDVDPPAETWRDHAEPMWIDDRVVVVPDWLQMPGHELAPNSVVVRIEPGGAFGLGDHPTTSLSLQATVRLIGAPCDAVDIGCGTGVVAITAALLQDRPVRAVDIASAAVEATRDNAQRNGVAAQVVVDATPAGAIEGDFDLVVANILAPTLVELSAELRRLTRPTGRLVISGILADRHQHVLRALEPMEVERTDVLDGWAAITLRHPDRR